ncbi:S41 family peptidase [Thalassospiraceae bacterium LMO-JJ14]|nr:S41 family peptidase [Thalassospiraceae bacterium LMO-JJ14]
MPRKWITPVVLPLLAISLAMPVAADDIADIAAQVAAAGHDVPPASVLRHACDTDPLCVARFLKDRIGPGAELLPDTGEGLKTRGWKARPALHRVVNDMKGTLFIVPARFDAKAIAGAIAGAVGDAAGQGAATGRLVLDLRDLDDAENLDAMRRTAALFTGRHERAFREDHTGGRAVDWLIPKPAKRLGPFAIEVWTDAEISAAAEAFAQLLRLHAGAKIMGRASLARGFVMKSIPVMPGWVLRIATGRLSVPGVDLTAGVQPDAPIPE